MDPDPAFFLIADPDYESRIRIQASIKDAQAIGEAFSPQKRTSSTSKHKTSVFFLFFWVIFALLDPDPDPQFECGSRSSNPAYGSGIHKNPDPQPCLSTKVSKCHLNKKNLFVAGGGGEKPQLLYMK
jgi:hypothetical protein